MCCRHAVEQYLARGNFDHALAVLRQEFIVFGKTPIASQIAESALDDPATRDENKTRKVIGAFDNFKVNAKGFFDP